MNAVSPVFDLDLLGAQICQLGISDIGSSQVVTASGIVPVNTSFQAIVPSPHFQDPNTNTSPGGANIPASQFVMPNGQDYVPPSQNILAAQILTLGHNAKIKVGI